MHAALAVPTVNEAKQYVRQPLAELGGDKRVMPTHHKKVTVPSDSELGLTMKAAQASGEPVIMDIGEDRYTVLIALAEPTRDIFAYYDPQAAVAWLRALDEVFAGVDRERLLRDLHAQRAQDSTARPA